MASVTEQALTRLTVNITELSVAALTEAAARTKDSKTDTVNRALQLYAFWIRTAAEGGEFQVARPDGLVELVTFEPQPAGAQ